MIFRCRDRRKASNETLPTVMSTERDERCLCFDGHFSFQGQLVAEIIHWYLPELVDVHKYSSTDLIEQKKTNWAMLNRKVLSHFGLDVPDVIVSGIANFKPGLIEVLLYNLRLKMDEEFQLRSKMHDDNEFLPKRQTSLSLLTEKRPADTRHMSISPSTSNGNARQTISLLDYEEIQQEHLQQEEQIEVLQAKLRRLEHVLRLKDKRIEQLSAHLEDDRTHRSAK
jgi:hypothetical protein